MKKILLILFIVAAFPLSAQYYQIQQDEGLIGGGLGVTWIDGQPHYAMRFFPEFAFNNFGIGLDLKLEYDSNGKIRTENFNTTSDYLSIIRYLRYGQKNDPVYVRLGALDYATLGHGSIMYMYNNSPGFDNRKIGMELDIDFNYFGFESVYGNFGEAGLLGLRGYIRPLKVTELQNTPIIGNLEVGASVVTDFHGNAGVLSGFINDAKNGEFEALTDAGTISIIGFDLGLPILRTRLVDFDLYYDYAKIIDYGSGSALGAIFKFKGFGVVDVWTKFERRWNGDQYIPAYFNSMYEIERFKFDRKDNAVRSKIQQLESMESVGDGFYGELLLRLVGTFNIIGSYQRLDDHPDSGILHLSADITPEGSTYLARAGYDKINIRDEKDLFKLDDRSYLFVEFGYKPMSYVIVSMVYNWTFTPERDADDMVIGYKPQKKIEPRVSFVYPLNFGG
ncbi:MAG: hypothetical protein JEY94_17990 [Melioribacteraceae bacterium]|nr:hypothetical protein [Melioribacteraceae bacterium]